MLKKNIIANFIGNFWGSALAIIMVPYYVRLLGVESYALIAFNSTLLTLLMLLDVGLSPTLGRQVTCFCAGEGQRNDLIGLLNSLEMMFMGMSLLLVTSIWLLSDIISRHWFQANQLSVETVAFCLIWMGSMAGFRWLSTLYRGGIVGLEKQVWLNITNSLIFTLRFAGVVPVIMIWPRIEVFFVYQTVTVFLECGLLRRYLRRELKANQAVAPRFSWGILKRHAAFSGSLAFTSLIWVLITQSDKLVLSKIIPLREYGYFGLAVLIAGGINVLSAPLHQAFAPRFTALAAQKDDRSLFELYHIAMQLVGVIAVPIGLVMAIWPESVLFAWTGDRQLAASVAPILTWYALGNVCLALITPCFYLQYAYGKLHLHVIGNVIFGVLLVPSIILVAMRYGALGAAHVWFVGNLLFLLVWVPIVHSRLAPGENRRWYIEDIIFPATAALLVGLVGNLFVTGNLTSRGSALFICVLVWAISAAFTSLASTRLIKRLPRMFAWYKA